jgi:hypothetical protein
MLLFLYALIYSEVKESEEKKREQLNEKKEDEEVV